MSDFDLRSLTGYILLGSVFNWGLLGALIIQVYIYALAFPKDSKYIKALVGWVFLLDLIHTAFTTHLAWHFLVEGRTGDHMSNVSVPPLSGLVAISVQFFFVWRIWKLAVLHKIIHFMMMGLISITAFGSLIAGFVCGAAAGKLNYATSSALNVSVVLWMAGSVASDVMITTTIVVQLLLRSSGNIFSYKTNEIVHRAIRMTIETGAVTATVVIFLYAKSGNAPVSGADFLLGYPLSKLYSNSLLASLNARAPIFQLRLNDTVTSGTLPWNAESTSNMNANGRHAQLGGLNSGDTTLFGPKDGITATKSSKTETGDVC